MAKYVKITKSKNLRYQLVSILYLLFITLTLLQIPVDWLRVNSKISTDFMNVTADDEIVDVQLATAIQQVEKLQSDFIKLNKIQKDPTGYKTTDDFFINQKKGSQLFAILFELNSNYQKMPSTHVGRKKFEELFKEDLAQGLATGQFKRWMEWKFKNVPGSVAQLLLNEILVRCHLIHGSLGITQKENNGLVKIAFNLDQLHLGDTAILVLNTGYTEDFKIFNNGKTSSDYFRIGDTVYFVPKKIGKYKLVASGIDKSEEAVEIQVSPMTISDLNEANNQNQKLHYFFQGKPSQITSNAILDGSKYQLSGGKWDNVRISKGKIEFTPTQSGWNLLKLQSSSGSLYLQDSVFVYPTPQPVVVASQVSNNKVSAKQLLANGSLKIKVFHPVYKDIDYTINEVDVNLIGEGIRNLKYNSDMIRLDNSQISKVRFIQIKRLKLNTSSGSMVLKEPLLIEVI